MKVTFHPGSREAVPALARALLAVADSPAGVQVVSVGRPGVTVDADVAARFLASLRTADPAPAVPRLAAVPTLTSPPPPPEPSADDRPVERRRGGRPRKTTTASSEG